MRLANEGHDIPWPVARKSKYVSNNNHTINFNEEFFQLPRYSPCRAVATTIHVGEGGRGTVILQGGTAASKEGHLRLPGQFYQGLHFGISAWNTWGEKVSSGSRCKNGV